MNNKVDEWIYISKKKSCKNTSKSQLNTSLNVIQESSNDVIFSKENFFVEMNSLKDSLMSVSLYSQLIKNLYTIINSKSNILYMKLIAFGIGDCIHNSVSKIQFALLLLLQDFLIDFVQSNTTSKLKDCEIQIQIFDPILLNFMNEFDVVCEYYKLIFLKSNDKAKIQVENDQTMFIYYMPHCPFTLYNNILWSHWYYLDNLLIIGNSFEAYEIRRCLSNSNHESNCISLLEGIYNEISLSQQFIDVKYMKNLKNIECCFNDLR